jgi:hypothetical protein
MTTILKTWFDQNFEKIIEESAKIEGLTPENFNIKYSIASYCDVEESNRLASLLKKVAVEILENQTFNSESVDLLVGCSLNECPECGSSAIQENEGVIFDNDGAWKEWACNDCPTTWEISAEVKFK